MDVEDMMKIVNEQLNGTGIKIQMCDDRYTKIEPKFRHNSDGSIKIDADITLKRKNYSRTTISKLMDIGKDIIDIQKGLNEYQNSAEYSEAKINRGV